MTAGMTYRTGFLIISALALTACSTESPPESCDRLATTLRLFPTPAVEKPEPDADTPSRLTINPATWSSFSDDLLSFEHPAGPDIKITVKDGSEAANSATRFHRTYIIQKADQEIFRLWLDRRETFDDSTCFCGAIVFEKYAFHHDALFRFSYLEGGRVKKVQALNNAYHAEALEWTHTPLTQKDYFRIAQSLRFRSPEKNPAARRAAIEAQYGFAGRLGFLERGMSREAVLARLGTPQSATPTALTYVREERDLWRHITTVPLRDGRFEGFAPDSLRCETIPPKRGSIRWMTETLRTEPFQTEAPPALPAADARLMFDRFAELAPQATPGDWSELCAAMNTLAERGHTDPRVLPLIRERFCDVSLTSHQAKSYLLKHDAAGAPPLLVRRANALLEHARTHTLTDDEPDWAGDLENLITAMPEESPDRLNTIRAALGHPRGDMRAAGLGFYEDLPEPEALSHLRRALSDPDTPLRLIAAKAFADDIGSVDDLTLLTRSLESEQDTSVREALNKAINRLKSMATN